MHTRTAWLLAAVSLAALAAAAPAAAQDGAGDAGTIEEVVVTAQKRAENIQDVPLSIMAVSEKAMEAKGVDDVRGLERVVPNLSISTIAQASGVALRIRG